MARGKKSPTSVMLVLIVCAIAWWLQNRDDLPTDSRSSDNGPIEIKKWKDSVEAEEASSEEEPSRVGGYDRFPGCQLVDYHGNDGDSFKVRFPNGEVRQMRLHFVDAPESEVKTYRDGNSNRKRINYQAKDLGGLSERETVAIGSEAKKWVFGCLGRAPFTVYTKWQEVFDSGRYYGLVSVKDGGQDRWLHELLVERGLARIYTEGARMPDGTSRQKQESHLRKLEQAAKSSHVGAWRK